MINVILLSWHWFLFFKNQTIEYAQVKEVTALHDYQGYSLMNVIINV